MNLEMFAKQPVVELTYQETLFKMIARDKEQIFNQAVESILGRECTKEDWKDFEKVIEKYSNKEWLLYKGKTRGYFNMEYITDSNFQPKLNLNFCFTSNYQLDEKIREEKEAKEMAVIAEKERQDKLWNAAEGWIAEAIRKLKPGI